MNYKEIIEGFAEDLIHLAPLPDLTPLQKLINRLYIKLRITGMPLIEVNQAINLLLFQNNITREKLLEVPNQLKNENPSEIH